MNTELILVKAYVVPYQKKWLQSKVKQSKNTGNRLSESRIIGSLIDSAIQVDKKII